MSDRHITYDGAFGMGTFEWVFTQAMGRPFWQSLTQGLTLPDLATEADGQCRNMHALLQRLDAMVDRQTAKRLLTKVRHGLHPSQSAWAREALLQAGDLDAFLQQQADNGAAEFTHLCENGEDFYGDPITPEVLAFVLRTPGLLCAVREGNRLYCRAFPANMQAYLSTDDERLKRYHACHCPFAKASLLSDKPVSSTLCFCSLGHVMNFWEAAFDRPLEGEVCASVLSGDLACQYVIYLPDDLMAQYVH